jgi:putative hydrolase of the HAD superfamily
MQPLFQIDRSLTNRPKIRTLTTVSSTVTYLLFDLDETLYPSSSGIVSEISRRMTRFVSRFLNLDEESAARIRRALSRKHGTTLTGLMSEHEFKDPESYLEFAHPTDVERYLHKDPELVAALGSISLPKSILTNAPAEHARRILEYLEIEPFFERIFDIRMSDFRGKPERGVYLHVLTELKREAAEVLFIDNRLDYLLAFREIGGRVVWLSEGGREEETRLDPGVPRIAHVKELPEFLARL